MPRKFVCDLRFHEVLQTTIIRQITKGNKEIEKIEKYSQKSLCGGIIVAYHCVWMCKWCLVRVCVEIHMQPNFHGIKYINLIYIYLLSLYYTSASDIDHSPNYIALGSSQTHKVNQ